MLRTRLFLNLLPFVAILLAVGVYAMVLFSRLASTVDLTVTESYGGVMAAQGMSLALAGMERQTPWLSDRERTARDNAFAAHQKRFEENLWALAKRANSPEEQDLHRQLVTAYRAFQEAMARVRSVRKIEPQRQGYEQDVLPNVLLMNTLLERIRDLNHQAILATSQSIQKLTSDVTRLMVIGMVIALIISAYACYQLSRAILQPIQLLTKATREVGEGNLAQPVPVLSRDELGQLATSFNKMAAQLQEYRQSTTEKIVQLHRTMETTLASFPDPIFVLNKEGHIELKNPAAEDLAASLHLGKELPARLQAVARKTLATGENFVPNSFKEAVSFHISGTDKFFLPRVVAMRDKEDALFGVGVALYDVTRFRLLDSVKTNLVATVSHELKSPLTSVRMVLHILLERTLGALTPKQDEMLLAARDDTERVLRILNDLLDLTRLEEGNTELRKESVAPVELLQTVIAETGDKVLTNGLKIDCSVDGDLPAVLVDRHRINYVFANLLSNAIKYSPPNSEVHLRATRVEDNYVQFSIIDHGPGIPENYQTRVFDRFFRVPGQTKPGAGLGLSIAKEITVAHGGWVGVKSTPGQGSAFYVVLKAAEPSQDFAV